MVCFFWDEVNSVTNNGNESLTVDSFRVWRAWNPIFPSGKILADGTAYKVVTKGKSDKNEPLFLAINFYYENGTSIFAKSKDAKRKGEFVSHTGMFRESLNSGEKVEAVVEEINGDGEIIVSIRKVAVIEISSS